MVGIFGEKENIEFGSQAGSETNYERLLTMQVE